MGANCPAAIPALLRGCLDAPNSRKSIIALASLSPRESSRIRTILRRDNLRPDIQLELALKDDVFEAALFLSEQLASTDSPAPPIKSSASDDGNEESESFSLRAHLETNPELVRVVLEKLTAELESGRSNTIIWVRTGILLNSIIRLLQTVSLQQFVKFKDAKGTISKMLIELKEWANLIADQTDAKCFSPLFSALVSFLVVVGEDESVRLDWSSGMDLLFRCKSPVNRALLARFVSAVRNKEVGTFVYDMNGHCLESHLDDWTVHQFEVASQWVPASLSCDLDQVLEQGTKEDALVADPAVGFCVIRTHTEEGASARAARQLLSTMLDSESYASPFLCSDVTPDLIDEAIECSLRGDDTFIPVVLPLEMEKISRDSSFRNRYSLTGKESRFLLCLFYTLSLRDQGGTSHNPFLPDVRELPLQQVYSVLATLSEDGISRSMRMKLKDLIARHCYESVPRSIYCDITRCEVERNSTVRAVLDVIHRSVRDPAWDPSGLLAERAFLWAQSELCPSVLISSTVNALVSDPSNTSRYYSYYGLCRDPVVVLQCPTEIWGRKGLRRVCLSLLSALLEANESIALESAPNDDVRQELIESRNTLVVRCLMKALCDDGRCYGPYCSSTLSLIRKIIAKNRGVFSTLLKQNLCSNELDWLVEWVPEVMEDGYALSSILSERNSLSTAERLVVADGIIRVAIAHGHRFPSETKVLVFSALSQLLSSFFLIVGPVGVPVTTLVGNGEGLDATHVSRKAAFRILKAISKVPSYRVQIRSECVMALQKLGGLCKGESSTGGSRQKNLMKELLDAITRTLGTLGSGIQI